jgi:hypothetical protein
MQYFKGDDLEKQFYNSASPIMDIVSSDKDDFAEGAYEAGPLGDLIYTANRAPLANAITQTIFRLAFKEIFDAFVVAGTFESYITVFKKIFGDDVTITFTVPGDGKLTIAIAAAGVDELYFTARVIVSNTYEFDHVITQDGIDNIMFQTLKGFQSQYELEQMLFEMVPAGIFTTITLTLG